MKTFLEAKQQFDNKYSHKKEEILAFLPVDLSFGRKYSIKNSKKQPNEEYYKWQFFYSLIHSGLYQKDYIGAEVSFPKGSKSSAALKLDGAIFDEACWFEWYTKWREKKNQGALDWLRNHLIAVIEFKKEDGKDVETVYNQQLKPAIKESEAEFCLGVLYDTGRLFLFQKRKGKYLRLDESNNQKGEKSSTKDLSLHVTDAYYKLPSFKQLRKKVTDVKIDRSKRTIDDLDIITGVFSTQINEAISDILRTLDKVSMLNQRGYEILIQMIALKIFDEKKNEFLKYYIQDEEHEDIHRLKFYIDPDERNYTTLNDENIQRFIKRIQNLKKQAESAYTEILSQSFIDWRHEGHVAVIGSIVHNLQDYSFTRSSANELYQLIFYRFANAFTKSEKGQFLTPIPIIEFLVNIVNPKGGETLADPTIGSGDFLSISYVKSCGRIDDKDIYGIDNDYQMTILAQLNMLLNGDGNAKIMFQSGKGSITHKFSKTDNLVSLIPSKHKRGNWDSWDDYTELKKFDVVLTNPPFGEDRKYEPKTQHDKEIIEMYELWHIARSRNWIDLGLVFLENAYRILKENGRLGIVLSNSIASIPRWEKARNWLIEHMRIVATFDLPANVFADSGVNTTLIVAYKPTPAELVKLNSQGYCIFMRDIQKVGYEIRTLKRVKYFNPIYKINTKTFEIEIDSQGESLLDEEFTETVDEFREWCLGQEKALQDLFIAPRQL